MQFLNGRIFTVNYEDFTNCDVNLVIRITYKISPSSLEEEDVESDISLFMEESADKEYSSESDTGDYSGYA